jgi:hypothetical protein
MKYNNRKIECNFDSNGRGNEPEDFYISEAWYVDTGEDIPEEELEKVEEENSGEMYEEWFQSRVQAAEYAFEGER